MQEDFGKNGVINQSAIKTMSIIELLAKNGSAMRLNDIAKELEMNVSTASRFLSSLRSAGYVEQNPDTLRYRLTLKIHAIVNNIDSISYLRETANPFLHALAERFNECICLGVEREMKVVYIDIVMGRDKTYRSEARIGNSTSLHCTGIGKLLMLNYSEEQICSWEQRRGYTIYTKNTIRNREELLNSIREARELDYAFDNEECEEEAHCIAVPIRDYTGKVIAGISVSGNVNHLTDEKIEKNKDFLIETARKISWRMGYQKEK